MEIVIFKESVLAEGGERPWGEAHLSDREIHKKAVKLLKEIWEEVSLDESWRDTLVIPPTI